MIDGLHILTEARTLEEWEKTGIPFSPKISIEVTNNVGQYKAENYKGFYIELRQNEKNHNLYKAFIRGSIAKHLQGNNLKDLTINEDKKAIAILQATCDIDNEYIYKMEIGVNIVSKYDIKYLHKAFILKRNKRFNRMDTTGNFRGLRVVFTDYSLKIYDKGRQYRITDKNIIRFEIVFNRNRILNKYNIYTLNDLKDSEKLLDLAKVLYSEIASCIIIDKKQEFTGKNEKVLYKSYTDTLEWEQLDKRKRYKQTKQVEAWQKKNDLGKTRSYILKKISQKTAELLEEKQYIEKYENDIKNNTIFTTQKRDKKSMVSKHIKNDRKGTFVNAPNTPQKEAQKRTFKQGEKATFVNGTQKHEKATFVNVDKKRQKSLFTHLKSIFYLTEKKLLQSVLYFLRKWVSKLLPNHSINFVQKSTENKQEKNVRKNIEQTI